MGLEPVADFCRPCEVGGDTGRPQQGSPCLAPVGPVAERDVAQSYQHAAMDRALGVRMDRESPKSGWECTSLQLAKEEGLDVIEERTGPEQVSRNPAAAQHPSEKTSGQTRRRDCRAGSLPSLPGSSSARDQSQVTAAIMIRQSGCMRPTTSKTVGQGSVGPLLLANLGKETPRLGGARRRRAAEDRQGVCAPTCFKLVECLYVLPEWDACRVALQIRALAFNLEF